MATQALSIGVPVATTPHIALVAPVTPALGYWTAGPRAVKLLASCTALPPAYCEHRQRYGNAVDRWDAYAGYRAPWEREADRLAQELAGIEQTPALLIVSAILRTMDADQYARVVEQLAPGAVAGRAPAMQAIATIKASRLCVGKQLDLFRAFDRMRGEA